MPASAARCAQCRGTGLIEGQRPCPFCHGSGVKPRQRPPRESAIVTACMTFLNSLPESWWRKTWGGGYSGAGMPDLEGCWSGRFTVIEVKQPGKKPTPLQQATLDAIQRAGGLTLTVHAKVELVNELNAVSHACTRCWLPVPAWAGDTHTSCKEAPRDA